MTSLLKARSFLFVPGDRPDRIQKALASAAHAVIVDLEDAVAPEAKSSARQLIAQALGAIGDTTRLLVRINACDSVWHDEDLDFAASHSFAAIVLPKSEESDSVARTSDRAGIPVIPLLESVRGLAEIDRIACAAGVARIAFGHLDFQLDSGLQCDRDERELDSVRLAIAFASRRAALPPPIDGVTIEIGHQSQLQFDTLRSKRLGFRAKLCIHPTQIGVVNEAFGPTESEISWARQVIAAARDSNSGAFGLNGAMIDAPVIQRAKTVLNDAAQL